MSVAKQLPNVDPVFMQNCPLCKRPNRIVVKGVYVNKDKHELHPDMGYSFCNCHDIFYTRPENLFVDRQTIIPDGDEITIAQPDPFFVEWGNDPYKWPHWNVRKYEILWDMYALVDYLKPSHDVIDYYREFDIHSKTPQHFYIKAKLK